MAKLQKEPTSIKSFQNNSSGVINVFLSDTFVLENISCLAIRKCKLAEHIKISANLIGA